MKDFKTLLNPPQLEAVETLGGPLLILAGAGSGKTRVLTYRIANLILKGRASPEEILAVTFTNKAAKGMEARTLDILRDQGIPVYTKLWISTFHSSCARILRDHCERLGYERPFAIYDDGEQMSVVKQACEALGINEKVFPPKNFLHRISEAKREAITPDKFRGKKTHFMDEKAGPVYELYEKLLKKSNAMDFDDLLLKTYLLFEQDPELLHQYQEKFRYILVDEYQDTNRIQYLLLKQLAHGHQNLCVVGDEDQSIYSWRGADITNILNFESDFPDAKVVKLECNYRSTKTIVEAASELIKNNTQRKNKTLFTDNDEGEKIVIREESSEYDEARFVVRQIEALAQGEPATWSEFAVFYRTNAQSRVLEDQLRSHGVPYRIFGSLKFYDRQEVKDVIAYLRLVLNPKDDQSFKRAIQRPSRRVGKTSLDKLEEIGVRDTIALTDVCARVVQTGELHSGALKGIATFLNLISQIQMMVHQAQPSEVLQTLLEESGYIKMLKDENTPESLARIDNLEELYNALTEFEKERAEEATLETFLEEVALVSDLDQKVTDPNSITLMTLHLSKGLEFPYGFIVGMEDGLFPSQQSVNGLDDLRLEEERRLAYVGMTRAEKRLFLSHARKRTQWGQEQMNPPSRFLKEIPDKFVHRQSAIAMPNFVKYYQRALDGQDSDNGGKPMGAFNQGKAAHSSGYGSLDMSPRTIRRPSKSEYAQESPDYENPPGFPTGTKVRHPTFGVGTVCKSEGSGEGQRVTILFSNNTLKTFALKYARLERV